MKPLRKMKFLQPAKQQDHMIQLFTVQFVIMKSAEKQLLQTNWVTILSLTPATLDLKLNRPAQIQAL